MESQNNSRDQYINELTEARQRISALEKLLDEQKEVEKASRKSEERYRDLIENTSDWIWEVDAQFRYTYSSSKIEDLLGYTPREILGKSPTDFMTPEEAARLAPLIHDLQTAPKIYQNIENENLHKDGSIRFLETSCVPVFDQDNRFIGYRGIDRDITWRKLAQLAFQRSEERYRDFLENVADACFEFDTHDHCTYCNESAHRMLGYTHEEYMELHNRQRYATPEESDRVYKIFQNIYNTGISSDLYEAQALRKDGTAITMEMMVSPIRDNQGAIIGFRGVGRDTTARKKEHVELERYRNFMENIADGCFENDLAGKLTYVNEIAARRLGLSREQTIGLNNRQYTRPEEAARIAPIFTEIYRTGKPAIIDNYEVLDQKGNIFFLEMSASLIRDAKGKPIGYRGTTRDVTEKKAIRDALKASEENYHLLIENSPIGIVVHSPDGRIMMSNRRAQEFFEMTEEAMSSLSADYQKWKLLRADGSLLPQNEYPVHLALAQNAPVNDLLVGIVRKNSGYTAWFLANAQPQWDRNGQLVRVIVSFIDITMRRNALEALARNEAKYRFLTEKMSDIVWTTDTEMNFTYISPSVKTALGYSQEEMMEHGSSHLLIPESLALVTAMQSKELNRDPYVSAEPKKSTSYETAYYHKNGNIVWFDNVASSIRDEKGKLIGFHGVSRNITEQKRAAEEKEQFIEEIRKALADVKTLSGMLPICSHCKKIRDDQGYWNQLEGYITMHSDALFSHCICPDCASKLYAQYLPKNGK